MNMDLEESGFVEAIENGRIVKVLESHAKKEGLPILRKSIQSNAPQTMQGNTKNKIEKEYRDERSKRLLDHLRKPSGWKDKQVVSELVTNFNWQISKKRRDKGMTRRQLASLTGTDEESIKLIENGLLPSPDFILINKIQTVLALNLRRDRVDFHKEIPMNKIKDEVKKYDLSSNHNVHNQPKAEVKEESDSLSGNDIEIFE